ncbi:MAG: beta-propeller domain-containing protein [Nannocystaceae bacterium]|nr:beta-propeller domain-containing protein [Nannocystaceae bacterium]
MKRRNPLALVALGLSVLGCSKGAAPPLRPGEPTPAQARREAAKVTDAKASPGLQRFATKGQLANYLEEKRAPSRRAMQEGGADGDFAEDSPALSAASADDAGAAPAEAESITNTQEAGVDEGGIVKTHGDHLVVLRRGRLFTVDLARRSLRPISAIDVSPERGHDAWYDEMLIDGDTIVVVGFSYQVGATEIGLFEVDARGKLSHRDTFFLSSNDYYSSRNYASRLLGDKLVFYMPYALQSSFGERGPDLPGVMPWERGAKQDWHAIIGATDIYRPIQDTDTPVLHTVVTCDLGKRDVDCKAQGVIGPYGRNFYVSGNAVYVWVHEGYGADSAAGAVPPGAVYRFPLAGGEPSALRVWGAPVDQFSFKEADGFLNVLVMADSAGDGMWGPEVSSQDVAMMRVPTAVFSEGVRTVNAAAYVDLPEPGGAGYSFQNRFVGNHLLYGTGAGWGGPGQGDAALQVFDIRGRDKPFALQLPHGVDRIEPMGKAAVVIGSRGDDLHFSSVALDGGPEIAGEFVQTNAAQGETRSHGFFFKPDGEDDGTLGLPIRGGGEPGYEQLINGSAKVLFLDVNDLQLRKIGALASDPNTPQDDRCLVSCVDWYGNARPIFYKGRVFALLGYELVEGKLAGRHGHMSIDEVDRTNLLSALGRGDGSVVWKSL